MAATRWLRIESALEAAYGCRLNPQGYHAVTPWVIGPNTAALIDYLKQAFGAEELGRVPNPDGSIGHAELRIGDSVVMLFDTREGWPATPAFVRLYVDDAAAVHQQAVAAGGTSVTDVTDLFFGDRVGRVRDPNGNLWWIQQHVEDVTPEEMQARMAEQSNLDAMQSVQDTLNQEMRTRGSK